MPTFEHEIDNWDGVSPVDIESEDYKVINATVEYTMYGEYRPEQLYLSNGDPGYPAEYPELDTVTVYDENGNNITDSVNARWMDILCDKCREDANGY